MNYKCKLIIQYACLTVLSIVAYQALKIPDLQIHRIEFVLNAIITTTTTISGFILTSLSILLGLNSHPIVGKIKKKQLMGELVWRYAESFLIGLIIIIGCILQGATLEEDTAILFVSEKWIKGGVCVLMWYLAGLFFLCKYLLGILKYTPSNDVAVDNTPGEPRGNYRI